MNHRAIIIFIFLFSLVGLAEDKENFILKIFPGKGNDIELTNKLKKPIFYNILYGFKNKNARILNEKHNNIIESLLSYRTAELTLNELNLLDREVIELIEPNYQYKIEQESTKPNDPRYYEQWALESLGAELAWKKASGKDIIIGVIDTGLEWEHEDLQNNVWINVGEDINSSGRFEPWPSDETRDGVSGDLNGIDEDRNGIVDDIIGYDFVNQKTANIGDWNTFDPIPIDEQGHGTLVSGVIAAEKNNNKGIVGLAYDSKIMVLRCFDITGHGNADNVATAIIYGVLNGVKVFNLSFGEKYNSSLMEDAVNFAVESGCIVVASAGNEGSDDPHYPSDYEGVISVGYSNKQNKRDNFSNYGSRLDLLAPGSYILTTSFLGDYRTTSGSSLAAPYVSALAAMMLESNPELNPFELSSIINLSADDYGAPGWDEFYGSGILNVNKALEYTALSKINLISPKNEETFDRTKTDSINIIGNIIVPLIDNYRLEIGESYNPDEWTELETSESQVLNDTIYKLDITSLRDSSYTFRILINLRNKGTIEKRVRFNIVSDTSNLKIVSVKSLPAYLNEKKIIVLAVETNHPSVISVKINHPTDSSSESFTDMMTKSKYHVVPIDDYLIPGIQYDCIVSASPDVLSKSRITKNIRISVNDDVFSGDKFIKKKYTTDLTYIYNKVTDFNKNGRPEYAVNNLSYGIWSGTEIYEFDDGLVKKDSITQIRIPVGIGDSNGDGLDELFTRNVGSSVLFQPLNQNSSVFSSILYADTTSGNFFAGEMYDYTDDGREELIAYSDTAVYIISYIEGKHDIIASAMLEGDLKRIGTAPGLVCGDFDGDGNHELAFGNERGNLFIFEFKNNSLDLEYSNTVNYSYSPQYMTKTDINNDGIFEIAILNFGTFPLFDRSVNAEPVWSMKILKSVSPNSYSYIFGEYFYGVKQGGTSSGVFFRNGISSGNIGTGADAVMVSPFPNFYTFVWNNSNKMEPFWHYPNSFANSAIVYDFDDNDINEFGFSTGRATEFFEYSRNHNKPNSPSEFEGWSISANEVLLQWKETAKDGNEKAEKYYLFAGEEKDGFINIIKSAETENLSFTFEEVTPEKYYWFGISSVSTSDIVSDTTLTKVFHHPPLIIKSAEQINQRRIKFTFSGIVPEFIPESGKFYVSSPDEIFAVSLARYNDSSFIAYWENPITPGTTEFTILSFRDYYNAPTQKNTIVIDIQKDLPIPEELYLKNIKVISALELELAYSEPIDINDGVILENYSLKPLGEIEYIIPINEASSVKIFLDKDSPIGPRGKNYTLTVENVKAQSGKKITEGAGNSLTFTFFTNSLDNSYIYPNPVKIGDMSPIYFANLTYQAEVFIYTLDGIELRKLTESDGNGGVEWDGRDETGNFLESGIYLFNVKGTDEFGNPVESGLKKFAVVR